MPANTSFARALRNSPTFAERRLWQSLRKRQLAGLKFTRQFPIGRYVVDFCCRERCLVIEVDGGQHDSRRQYDRERDEHLAAAGYHVIRLWNNEVLGNLDGVLEAILAAADRTACSGQEPTL